MANSRFPPGWDEGRVQTVLAHYEAQSDDEALAEDETALPQSLKAAPSAGGRARESK